MTNPFGPAPAAPATGNPFGAPAPQFAPPQQHSAPAPAAVQAYTPPAPAAAPAAPALGSFRPAAPVVSGGGGGAKLPDMYGRLVLILPIKIERGIASNFKDDKGNAQVQDRMTATVVVLDGGPIAFGGAPYKMPPTPHTQSEPLPYVSKGLWISQAKLVEQCEPALATVAAQGVGKGMVLGRLLKNGTEANSAWILGEYTAAEADVAQYYLDAVARGDAGFPNPLA